MCGGAHCSEADLLLVLSEGTVDAELVHCVRPAEIPTRRCRRHIYIGIADGISTSASPMAYLHRHRRRHIYIGIADSMSTSASPTAYLRRHRRRHMYIGIADGISTLASPMAYVVMAGLAARAWTHPYSFSAPRRGAHGRGNACTAI